MTNKAINSEEYFIEIQNTSDSTDCNNKEKVIDSNRDTTYFQYYSQLIHQANMLQDQIRTSCYQNAILRNAHCFESKIILDVGAGSGILSFFALHAGSKMVYAVEASEVAYKLKKLIDCAASKVHNNNDPFEMQSTNSPNFWLNGRIKVIKAKMETPNLPIPKVDTIISEPIGVLIVHERMIESYLLARDLFLKPNGAMFPSQGRIYLCPFTDSALYSEKMTQSRFWENNSFYGVDFSSLFKDSVEEVFRQPVVGCFDSNLLMADITDKDGYFINFCTVKIEALYNFTIPFRWTVSYTGLVHGIAGWFDIYFIPPSSPETNDKYPVVLSTSPKSEKTHWQQIRFLLQQPLAVNCGQIIEGFMKFEVNSLRSYNLSSQLWITKTCQGLLTNTPKFDSSVHEPTSFRAFNWNLHEQAYSYNPIPSYGDQLAPIPPELLNLYKGDMSLSSNTFSASNSKVKFDQTDQYNGY